MFVRLSIWLGKHEEVTSIGKKEFQIHRVIPTHDLRIHNGTKYILYFLVLQWNNVKGILVYFLVNNAHRYNKRVIKSRILEKNNTKNN